jgi:hypothetical protein
MLLSIKKTASLALDGFALSLQPKFSKRKSLTDYAGECNTLEKYDVI